MTEHAACPVCGHDLAPGLTSWHLVCGRCRYEGSLKTPSINEHSAHALLDEQNRAAGLKALRQTNFRTILETLDSLSVRHGASILDVGCAHGWFLELAQKDYRPLGLEPDRAVFEATQARKLAVRNGYFPDALDENEVFDVIVFNDVFEHIPDVGATLAAIRRHLAPDGLLVLNLPNSRGFFYALAKVLRRFGMAGPFDRLWQVGFPSVHVHYFDRANASALCVREGFRVVHTQSLPALSRHGLKERIACDRKIGRLRATLLFLMLRCGLPILGRLPSDIMAVYLRKGPDPAIVATAAGADYALLRGADAR